MATNVQMAGRPGQRSVVPLLLSLAVGGLGGGLLSVVLPLRLERAGVSTEAIGLVLTANGAGFLVGCLVAGRLVRSVGHVRAHAAFAALAALTVLLLALRDDPALWSLLRGLAGFCMAGTLMVTESWLNEATPNERRGAILALYTIVWALSSAVGQLAVEHLDVTGPEVLMIVAGCYVAALVPVSAARVREPPLPQRSFAAIGRVFRLSPSGATGCLAAGLISGAFYGLEALYASGIGLDQAQIARIMAASQVGALLLQWPFGYASDRLDRRLVMIVVNLGLVAVTVVLALFDQAPTFLLLLLLFALLGGLVEAIYPIAMAQANDYAEPKDYLPVSGSLLLIWAGGSAIGPPIGAFLLQQSGPLGLFGYLALLAALHSLFLAWRLLRRRPAPATPEVFVAYPHTTPAAHGLVPHHPDTPGSEEEA